MSAITLTGIERELANWHEKKYGSKSISLPATIAKLMEEVGEFIEAAMSGDPDHTAEEAADVLFVMCHIVRETGGCLGIASADKLVVINDRLINGKKP